MSRKALLLVAVATASFAPHRIRLRSSRVSWQMLRWAAEGMTFSSRRIRWARCAKCVW